MAAGASVSLGSRRHMVAADVRRVVRERRPGGNSTADVVRGVRARLPVTAVNFCRARRDHAGSRHAAAPVFCSGSVFSRGESCARGGSTVAAHSRLLSASCRSSGTTCVSTDVDLGDSGEWRRVLVGEFTTEADAGSDESRAANAGVCGCAGYSFLTMSIILDALRRGRARPPPGPNPNAAQTDAVLQTLGYGRLTRRRR